MAASETESGTSSTQLAGINVRVLRPLTRTNLTPTDGICYEHQYSWYCVIAHTSRRVLSACLVQVYVSPQVPHRAARMKRWGRLLPVLGAQLLEVQTCSKQGLGLYSVNDS